MLVHCVYSNGWGEPTHFMPDGNPAPPRPRKPEALISDIICLKLSATTFLAKERRLKPAYPVVAL